MATAFKTTALSKTVLSQSGFSKSDLADLMRAKNLLEHPSLASRVSAILGSPIERGISMLPDRFQKTVHQASEAALMKALDVAVGSLNETAIKPSKNRLHKLAAATSGAIGGVFGLAALAFELPVSTTIMLRSIADIAKAKGKIFNTSTPSWLA